MEPFRPAVYPEIASKDFKRPAYDDQVIADTIQSFFVNPFVLGLIGVDRVDLIRDFFERSTWLNRVVVYQRDPAKRRRLEAELPQALEPLGIDRDLWEIRDRYPGRIAEEDMGLALECALYINAIDRSIQPELARRWAETSRCRLAVVQMQPGETLGFPDDLIVKLSRSHVIFLRSTQGEPVIQYDPATIHRLPLSQPVPLSTAPIPTPTTTTTTTADRDLVERLGDLTIEDDGEWMRGLRSYLRDDLLPRFIQHPQVLDWMVSESAMAIWTAAFTDESYNPNLGENYEELETRGDAFMAAAFFRYLQARFGNALTRRQLSELKTHYLSTQFQARMARELGLDRWIRTRLEKNTKMFEDVMESFMGALWEIGDQVVRPGTGSIMVYNATAYLFNPIQIDIQGFYGSVKSRIKEIFEKLGWGYPIEETAEVNGQSVFTVKLTPEASRYLRTRNLAVPVTLSQATGTTSKVAENRAYEEALATLTSYGVTQSWANQQVETNEFANPTLAPYYQETLRKLRREGYEKMYFKTRSTKYRHFIQLIGVRPDGRLVPLITRIASTRPGDPMNLSEKQTVMMEYLRD